MSEALEFVFSVRSPYAWIAARHVVPMLHPATPIRWTPFFPLPSFPNFGGELLPAKVRHNVQDIVRLCTAYGLSVRRPPLDEPDWLTAHAAFLWADRQGRGPEFATALMDERWAHGRTVSTEPGIRRVADRLGMDADQAAAAALDEGLRAELTERVQTNYDERHIFGVPMLILPSGEYFWGHDRMDWALRYGFVKSAA